MKIKKETIATGLTIGVWAATYVFLQNALGAMTGQTLELWPALMAPGIVKLMGNNKEAQKNFYKCGLSGLLLSLLFVLCEQNLPAIIGPAGIYFPLLLAIALIMILGELRPDWFSSTTVIIFNAALIQTDEIILRTLFRAGILLIGATIFLWVEHLIITSPTVFRRSRNAAET